MKIVDRILKHVKIGGFKVTRDKAETKKRPNAVQDIIDNPENYVLTAQFDEVGDLVVRVAKKAKEEAEG